MHKALVNLCDIVFVSDFFHQSRVRIVNRIKFNIARMSRECRIQIELNMEYFFVAKRKHAGNFRA